MLQTYIKNKVVSLVYNIECYRIHSVLRQTILFKSICVFAQKGQFLKKHRESFPSIVLNKQQYMRDR